MTTTPEDLAAEIKRLGREAVQSARIDTLASAITLVNQLYKAANQLAAMASIIEEHGCTRREWVDGINRLAALATVQGNVEQHRLVLARALQANDTTKGK